MPQNRFVGVASTYDRTIAHMLAPEGLDPAVDCLASLAAGGRVLEATVRRTSVCGRSTIVHW